MSDKKLAIDMTPEELEQWLNSLETEDGSIPEFHFSNPDPYFKITSAAEPKHRSYWFEEDGRIAVRNYCAAELPKITVTIRSGRTTYRFNGSYDGTRSLTGKLLTQMANDL